LKQHFTQASVKDNFLKKNPYQNNYRAFGIGSPSTIGDVLPKTLSLISKPSPITVLSACAKFPPYKRRD
jgi:hypothetical protein